jgi:putative ABC transport system permease protein
MLKNYFKIAWRNLWKNKVFSLINIFGLSVGIAFTLIIGAYVWVELQINRQLNNADNQYIIQSKWKDPNMGIELTSIAQLPKTLRTVYPHLVANYTMTIWLPQTFPGASVTFAKTCRLAIALYLACTD